MKFEWLVVERDLSLWRSGYLLLFAYLGRSRKKLLRDGRKIFFRFKAIRM